MKKLADFTSKVYDLLLWLYPAAFRNEFREQMLMDFLDMANDARDKGSYSFLRFWFRELYHFPAGLLQAHWRDGMTGKILRSQPINYGLRNALVFGLAYGLSVIISEWIFNRLVISENSIFSLKQVFDFDLFHTQHGLDVISLLPSALSSLVIGLVIGVSFAFLFADRSDRVKYALITMICWFLSREALGILWNTPNVCFSLGSRYCTILQQISSLLSGLFLGLIFYLANRENRLSFRFLVLGMFSYPIITYIYVQLLRKFSMIEKRIMFPSLLILLLIYVGSVLAIAFRSRSIRKVPWVVILVAISYLILPRIVHNPYFSVIPVLPLPSNGILVDSPQYWSLYSRLGINEAMYGIVFGLFIGVVFGLLNRRKVEPSAT